VQKPHNSLLLTTILAFNASVTPLPQFCCCLDYCCCAPHPLLPLPLLLLPVP
jgi:hypothetical protein